MQGYKCYPDALYGFRMNVATSSGLLFRHTVRCVGTTWRPEDLLAQIGYGKGEGHRHAPSPHSTLTTPDNQANDVSIDIWGWKHLVYARADAGPAQHRYKRQDGSSYRVGCSRVRAHLQPKMVIYQYTVDRFYISTSATL